MQARNNENSQSAWANRERRGPKWGDAETILLLDIYTASYKARLKGGPKYGAKRAALWANLQHELADAWRAAEARLKRHEPHIRSHKEIHNKLKSTWTKYRKLCEAKNLSNTAKDPAEETDLYKASSVTRYWYVKYCCYGISTDALEPLHNP